MNRRILSIVMIAILSMGFPSTPSQPAKGPLLPPFPYEDEGDFVTVPAIAGGLLFGMPGSGIGFVVCLPASMLTNGRVTAWDCMIQGGIIASLVGSSVVGFPFYMTKTLFWDWPKAIYLYLVGYPYDSTSPFAYLREPVSRRAGP